MTSHFLTIAILMLVSMSPKAMLAGDRKPLGEIDFFGSKGFDTAAIRSALPFHEGDLFPPAKIRSPDDLKRKVAGAVKQVIGREPTDVAFVCCDSRQHWMVYIGLPGESYQAPEFNRAPTGDIRLPKAALALRRKFDNAWMSAVMKGRATEDDSEGFALMDEPKAKAAALALRKYALLNEALILEVLGSSSDARHRAIAAQMLGYGRQSDQQIAALVRAALDSDDQVRNDVLRALAVLAGAKPNLAQSISPLPFVRLLRSGAWTDHNKASLLLLALTKGRDPKLLATLRTAAIDSLIEIAEWRSKGHAAAALLIIGRISGIGEEPLNELVEAGQTDAIVGKFR